LTVIHTAHTVCLVMLEDTHWSWLYHCRRSIRDGQYEFDHGISYEYDTVIQ